MISPLTTAAEPSEGSRESGVRRRPDENPRDLRARSIIDVDSSLEKSYVACSMQARDDAASRPPGEAQRLIVHAAVSGS